MTRHFSRVLHFSFFFRGSKFPPFRANALRYSHVLRVAQVRHRPQTWPKWVKCQTRKKQHLQKLQSDYIQAVRRYQNPLWPAIPIRLACLQAHRLVRPFREINPRQRRAPTDARLAHDRAHGWTAGVTASADAEQWARSGGLGCK